MAHTIKPPMALDPQRDPRTPSIFLAGSIENGKAENWQDRLTREIGERDVLVLNPRRDDWDASWEQTIADPQFNEQVKWELQALECAGMIAMYFDPATQSPISLLELGLHARSRKLVVYCPSPFWRKGNVDIVCEVYGIPNYDTWEDFVGAILARLDDC